MHVVRGIFHVGCLGFWIHHSVFGAASHPVAEVGQTAEEHDQDEHRQHQVGGGVVGDVVERDNLVHEPHEGALGVQARINYRRNK